MGEIRRSGGRWRDYAGTGGSERAISEREASMAGVIEAREAGAWGASRW
jgi:hypothetical protein